MKWFTPEWSSGGLSDYQVEKTKKAYSSHLDSLLSTDLPAAVRALAQSVNLHDGLIRRCRVDPVADRVMLMMRCGDNQSGYFDLELRYENVARPGRTAKQLKAVASDPSTEALFDEIDFGQRGGWVHRILFQPYREVTVEFTQLGLRMVPRKARAFRRSDVPVS